ncbi:MAG: hypothetical protein A3F11_01115 [Gammaproteobacteria bacterium RIFCSPHIGHO2_12_FULL_37_14]|nr:MAG: hypothetical protein A3F11_01115 [Gammaproteobacteria bacterium RIFCSPHIGHO2_12_FULL_37_14]
MAVRNIRNIIQFVILYAFCNSDLFAEKLLSLSLDEAILIAARSNPNVQESQLTHVLQKFNLHVEEWQFDLHYSFQASAGVTRSNVPHQPTTYSRNYNIQPGVSYKTPIGTQLNLISNNPITENYNPSLSIQLMQPLMRGFGKAIVETALNNARDSEVISRLSIEGTLRNTITAVINAYLDVVAAEQTIEIDQAAVKRAAQSIDQTKMYIKAGRKAGNELVTVEADRARAESQLINDKNNLVQTRYALLMAIGMDPNADIHFTSLNVENLINKYLLPSLNHTKRLMLENDIQYQIDQIILHGSTTRSLSVAKDNTRWQLNLEANVTTGSVTEANNQGQNAGINGLFNSPYQTQGIGLTLEIPINDQLSKQAVVNAQIALKQAELALLQEKWNKETSAINGWNSVVSAKRSLQFAENAELLQKKTYTISYQKYLHGLIDSLELQSAQLQLIQAQQVLLRERMGYLKALVNLDLIIGNTLRTWNVKVRL